MPRLLREAPAIIAPIVRFRRLSSAQFTIGLTRTGQPEESFRDGEAPDKTGMAVFPENLFASLAEFGIGQAVVGGISMGAAVAIDLALPSLERHAILTRVVGRAPSSTSGYS